MENFVTKISFLVYFEKTWLHHGLMSGRTDIYSMISFFLIGNKAKGRISKRVFQKSKAGQIFRKTNLSYPPDTHTYVLLPTILAWKVARVFV